MQCGTDMDIQ